jgi:hypothetical protein
MPYGVQITAGGRDYSFVLDTEKGVRELVDGSMRVTAVRVWNENVHPVVELTKDEVNAIMQIDDNAPEPIHYDLPEGLLI